MNINLTLIGQSLTFFVFVWFCMKFVWPPIMNALHERKTKIADGLAAAEHGQHEQELAKKRASEVLHDAKQNAADIINQAQKRAGEIVEESKTDARAEGQRLLTAAKAEIDQEVQRAKEALRAELGMIVISGAEKVLEREVDASVHDDMIKKLATQI
ncbi:F0F1 ATP synthase subunit B [Sulfuriflexus sp.]|uniref:F0F1 ATP synthase subunit B n=1 Tax=Sulfuriflexus sp. TaxID=2015443 RepID=UPI0028CD2177|nr:F0F1 ATP synthase subunit B [Sulfuriflexus sp.]MDT8404102.1 F0F1 ATP synthase subunit B [Sulfuriflexus sp.]